MYNRQISIKELKNYFFEKTGIKISDSIADEMFYRFDEQGLPLVKDKYGNLWQLPVNDEEKDDYTVKLSPEGIINQVLCWDEDEISSLHSGVDDKEIEKIQNFINELEKLQEECKHSVSNKVIKEKIMETKNEQYHKYDYIKALVEDSVLGIPEIGETKNISSISNVDEKRNVNRYATLTFTDELASALGLPIRDEKSGNTINYNLVADYEMESKSDFVSFKSISGNDYPYYHFDRCISDGIFEHEVILEPLAASELINNPFILNILINTMDEKVAKLKKSEFNLFKARGDTENYENILMNMDSVYLEDLPQEEIEFLWEKLGNEPFEELEDGQLVLDDDFFLGFERGTDRETIWHWFDKVHPEGVAYLLNDYTPSFLRENKNQTETKQKTYTNKIIDKIKAAGIEVVTDKDEFEWTKEHISEVNITLEMLEEVPLVIQEGEKKEIGNLSPSNNDKLTRSQSLNKKNTIDSSNSQDIINNLNNLKSINTKLDGNDFLTAIKHSFYLDERIDSNYVHERNSNIELRLSNHCANANDSKRYDKSTSIVIKLVRGKNAPKFRKAPNADVVEFAYYPENLTLESEKAIINGLIDWVKTGEYTYTQSDEFHQSTRKEFIKKHKKSQKMTPAKEQEFEMSLEGSTPLSQNPEGNTAAAISDVNDNSIIADIENKSTIQKMTAGENTYGFIHNGKIYLNPEIMNSNAAVHEYTHLWDAYTQKTNPELWKKGLELFKNTKYWNEVTSDPNYQDIRDDDNLVLSEIHSRICGDIAEKVLNRIAELDGEQVKLEAIEWNEETWNYICEVLLHDNKKINYESGLTSKDLQEFLSTPLKDLIEERKIGMNNMNKNQNIKFVDIVDGYSDNNSRSYRFFIHLEQNDTELKNKLNIKNDTEIWFNDKCDVNLVVDLNEKSTSTVGIVDNVYLRIDDGYKKEEFLTERDIKLEESLKIELCKILVPMMQDKIEEKLSFENDVEKMRDFFQLSKEDFLESYSYLTEEEYEATKKYVESNVEKKQTKDVNISFEGIFNLKAKSISNYESDTMILASGDHIERDGDHVHYDLYDCNDELVCMDAVPVKFVAEINEFTYFEANGQIFALSAEEFEASRRFLLTKEFTDEFYNLQIAEGNCEKLLAQGADPKYALYPAAEDAFLGDNLRWLIEHISTEKWEEIKSDRKYCKEVFEAAKNSIMNDFEFTVSPMLELAEKIDMVPEAVVYCKELEKTYRNESEQAQNLKEHYMLYELKQNVREQHDYLLEIFKKINSLDDARNIANGYGFIIEAGGKNLDGTDVFHLDETVEEKDIGWYRIESTENLGYIYYSPETQKIFGFDVYPDHSPDAIMEDVTISTFENNIKESWNDYVKENNLNNINEENLYNSDIATNLIINKIKAAGINVEISAERIEEILSLRKDISKMTVDIQEFEEKRKEIENIRNYIPIISDENKALVREQEFIDFQTSLIACKKFIDDLPGKKLPDIKFTAQNNRGEDVNIDLIVQKKDSHLVLTTPSNTLIYDFDTKVVESNFIFEAFKDYNATNNCCDILVKTINDNLGKQLGEQRSKLKKLMQENAVLSGKALNELSEEETKELKEKLKDLDYEQVEGILVHKDKKITLTPENYVKEVMNAKLLVDHNHVVYLLPENFAFRKKNEFGQNESNSTPDTLTDNEFVELKTTDSKIGSRFGEAVEQANNVLIRIQDDISLRNVRRRLQNKINNLPKEKNIDVKDGKLFLYFEKKGKYIEAEIKQGKINILPAEPELADFSVVPPANNIISQAEELSSSIPKINKMMARSGLYWNGKPYEYTMAQYALNSNLDMKWLNHFFGTTSSDIHQFTDQMLQPQVAQEMLQELLKTAESMDYTGDAVSHKSKSGKERLRTFEMFAEQIRNGNIGYYDRGAPISTGAPNWTTVNGSEVIDEPEYMFKNGFVAGLAYDNNIILHPDYLSSNAAVHEYTHLWDAYTQKTNPELWNKGLKMFKNSKYWNEVISDPNYQDIKDDENLVLSEIHSRICGDIAEKVLNRIAELDGEQVKLDAIDWNKEVWNYISNEMELSKEYKVEMFDKGIYKTDLQEFLSTPMKDLIEGKNIKMTHEFDFEKLADDLIQIGLENSMSTNYQIGFKEIANLAGKNEEWVKENIENIRASLSEHNDNELLDYPYDTENEDIENVIDLNYCSLEDDDMPLFRKEKGRWIRKSEEEVALYYDIQDRLHALSVVSDVKIYQPEKYGFNKDDKLHVLVEYEGNSREDDLFNTLHDESNPLVIDGREVDCNPINIEKSGTVEQYLDNLSELQAADNRILVDKYCTEKQLNYNFSTKLDYAINNITSLSFDENDAEWDDSVKFISIEEKAENFINLIKLKDSILNLDVKRPSPEQLIKMLDNGWNYKDSINGFRTDVIAGELDKDYEIIDHVSAGEGGFLDSDIEAAEQAEKLGIKVISQKELFFVHGDTANKYRYADTPENRELLKDNLLSLNSNTEQDKKIEKLSDYLSFFEELSGYNTDDPLNLNNVKYQIFDSPKENYNLLDLVVDSFKYKHFEDFYKSNDLYFVCNLEHYSLDELADSSEYRWGDFSGVTEESDNVFMHVKMNPETKEILCQFEVRNENRTYESSYFKPDSLLKEKIADSLISWCDNSICNEILERNKSLDMQKYYLKEKDITVPVLKLDNNTLISIDNTEEPIIYENKCINFVANSFQLDKLLSITSLFKGNFNNLSEDARNGIYLSMDYYPESRNVILNVSADEAKTEGVKDGVFSIQGEYRNELIDSLEKEINKFYGQNGISCIKDVNEEIKKNNNFNEIMPNASNNTLHNNNITLSSKIKTIISEYKLKNSPENLISNIKKIVEIEPVLNKHVGSVFRVLYKDENLNPQQRDIMFRFIAGGCKTDKEINNKLLSLITFDDKKNINKNNEIER